MAAAAAAVVTLMVFLRLATYQEKGVGNNKEGSCPPCLSATATVQTPLHWKTGGTWVCLPLLPAHLALNLLLQAQLLLLVLVGTAHLLLNA